ncbi:MAG: BlaI/MecI/CopY family transcriptional regulator [Reichenbachiella sp.]|uniref:BlaI/MecI/CopY family transcriptional regulator n=1 Tax=Reichenbachiella sp. TaxID=2184521 RepID=UPI00326344C4
MNAQELNKRERQILDIIYQLHEASVQEVVDRIADAPSYNAIRVTMYLLENKGFLIHRREGAKYIFKAKKAKTEAGNSALDHILVTFFEGSIPKLVNSLMGSSSKNLSKQELKELEALIEKKKKQENNQS